MGMYLIAMHVAEGEIPTPEDAERIALAMDEARWEGWDSGNHDEWVDADPAARLELDWTLQTVERLIAGEQDAGDHEVHTQMGFSVYSGHVIPGEEGTGTVVQSAHEVEHAASFLEAFVADGTLDRNSAALAASRDEGLRAGRAALRRTASFYQRARDRKMAVIKYISMT